MTSVLDKHFDNKIYLLVFGQSQAANQLPLSADLSFNNKKLIREMFDLNNPKRISDTDAT